MREAALRLNCSHVFLRNIEVGNKRPPPSFQLISVIQSQPDFRHLLNKEWFLWDIYAGSPGVVREAVASVLKSMMLPDPPPRYAPVAQSLVEYTGWPPDSGAHVCNDHLTLTGNAGEIQSWPRALSIDFLIETTEKWMFDFKENLITIETQNKTVAIPLTSYFRDI